GGGTWGSELGAETHGALPPASLSRRPRSRSESAPTPGGGRGCGRRSRWALPSSGGHPCLRVGGASSWLPVPSPRFPPSRGRRDRAAIPRRPHGEGGGTRPGREGHRRRSSRARTGRELRRRGRGGPGRQHVLAVEGEPLGGLAADLVRPGAVHEDLAV